MHRKFLFQLILQAAIPTVLIVIPSGLFATALTFDLIGLKCESDPFWLVYKTF